MFCTFCIVPHTRGREISRPAAGDRSPRSARSRRRGVREVILLGQTVNAYGRHDVRRGRAAADARMPFAELLARLAAVPGIDAHPLHEPAPVVLRRGADPRPRRARGALPARAPARPERLRRRARAHAPAATPRARPARLAERPARRAPGPRAHDRPDRGLPRRDRGRLRAPPSRSGPRRSASSTLRLQVLPAPGHRGGGPPGPVPEEVAQDAPRARSRTSSASLTLAAHRARVGSDTEVLVEGPSRRAARQAPGPRPLPPRGPPRRPTRWIRRAAARSCASWSPRRRRTR